MFKNVSSNDESSELLDRSSDICQISLENINILTLNVCGLKSKMKSPDFEFYISKYDLIFLTVTKFDYLDQINIDGFTTLTNNRKYKKRPSGGVAVIVKNRIAKNVEQLPFSFQPNNKINTKLDDLDQIIIDGFTTLTNNRKYKKRPSGGVAVIVKNRITKNVEQLPFSFKDTIWVKIKNLFEKPIVMAAIYNPPENSRYADDNLFYFIEKVVLDNYDETCSICLFGDLNARTANLSDSVQDDALKNVENQEFVPLQRSNQDNTVNQYGLYTIRSVYDLYIVNGRCGEDKYVGKTTSKNVSTVGFCIVTKDIFDKIEQFEVKEFDDMWSVIHCPLHLSLVSYTTSER